MNGFVSSLNAETDPDFQNYTFRVVRESERAGIPHHIEIQHGSNGFSRGIHFEVPSPAIGNPQTRVVFMPDGQLVHLFAENANLALRRFSGPPTAYFGLSCTNLGINRINRANEYLGLVGEPPFDNHYDVFIRILPKIAQRLLQVPLKRCATVVAGFSNGGAFAYRMAIGHPELFGNAILMSPSRVRQPVDLSKIGGYSTRIFLAAGEEGLERLFKKNALKIKQDLDQAGVASLFWHDEHTGHDIFLWNEAFAHGLSWLFHDGSTQPG